MLNVRCPDRMARAKKFAEEVGLSDQLEAQLQYLATYGGGEHNPNYCRCDLFDDFAPHSFGFCMYRTKEGEKPEFWFNGGLLYQGPTQPADGSTPLFSVSLHNHTGWFVHT